MMNTNNFSVGTGAILLTDVIGPLLDEAGFPTFSLREGEKVYVTSLEPLTVCKESAMNHVIPVESDWIQTVKGRPRKF
jgi:hypothetical protein